MEELPVAFAAGSLAGEAFPHDLSGAEPVVMEPDGDGEPFSEPPVAEMEPAPVVPADEIPVLASFMEPPATLTETPAPLTELPSSLAEEALPLASEPTPPVSEAAPGLSEAELPLVKPPVPPLAQRTSLSKAEPQQLAPEPAVDSSVSREKAGERPASKKAEPEKKAPAPKAAATPAAKKEKRSNGVKEPSKKEVQAEEELLEHSRTDELMLVPSGGEPKAYRGDSPAAPAEGGKPERASSEDEAGNIIVNKQDVFTLSPTDSIGPDGQPGDGQKSYTPQKSGTTASPAASESGDGKSGKAGSPAPTGTGSVQPSVAAAVREQDLRAGNYVQFTTCTTDAEAEKLLSKYRKYPVIKVLFEKRAGYKLLVGPLGDDEKGAVLARFKAFGFGDAYLRKVK